MQSLNRTMENPDHISCSVPGCCFKTPTHVSISLQIELLKIHSSANHPSVLSASTPALSILESLPLPRPVFSLNMTLTTWQCKEREWQSYIAQAPVFFPESVKLDQLRAACDESLRQRLRQTEAFTEVTSAASLLDIIQDLVVHQSVHRANLYQMFQKSDESIGAFVARLTGTADLSSLVVHCETCQENVSYRDEVIKSLVINGVNQEVRQEVIRRISNGELSSLTSLVDFISAQEVDYSSLHNEVNGNDDEADSSDDMF